MINFQHTSYSSHLERERRAQAILQKNPLGEPPYVLPLACRFCAPDLFFIPNRRVTVLLQKHSSNDGRGDESFACKTYELIRGKTPFHVSLRAIRKFDQDHLSTFRPDLPIDPFTALAKEVNECPTLVLHGPCLEGENTNGVEEPEISFDVFDRSTVYHMEEYSLSRFTKELRNKSLYGEIAETGLGPEEWGIFCDDRLYEKSSALAEKGEDCDPTELASLQHQPLRNALSLQRDKRLYVGYCKRFQTQQNYSLYVLTLEKGRKNDIDICILNGSGEPSNDFRDQFKTFYITPGEYRDKHLSEFGLKAAELIEWDKETGGFKTSHFYESPNSAGQKKLRFIFCGVIPHADVLRLLLGSQPLVAVTGDQSLGEALMCRKVVLYDRPRHKDPLTHHLATLCDKYGDRKAGVLLMEQNPYVIVKLLEQPNALKDLQKGASSLAKYIYRNKNLGNRLISEIDLWNTRQLREERASRCHSLHTPAMGHPAWNSPFSRPSRNKTRLMDLD